MVLRSFRVACIVLIFGVPSVHAQQMLIDQQVRAGGLIFFPDLNNSNRFYYAPTRARLAQTDSGKPQFSLLRYVENIDGGSDRSDEGQGGGILHAVVELGVSDEELEEARGELRRLRSGAEIAGPILFTSGRFGLVSSFANEDGELTKRVIGLGSAPVLEGSKAAVSLQLTKLGSKVIWESFQSATPDVSFAFEMEAQGYLSPKKAILEAELDEVYKHQNFSAGIATTYMEAEINQAFDDLYREGKIKLTQVGDDESLNRLIQDAYGMIKNVIFQPTGGGGALNAVAGPGKESALDRASELLDRRRKEVREDNTARRKERAEFLERTREEAKALRAALQKAESGKSPASGNPELLKALSTLADGLERSAGAHGGADSSSDAEEFEEQALPEMAAVMTYEMKEARQQIKFRVDLNKHTAADLPVSFTENIGDLRRFIDDESVFRNVNLDDPLYKQREIALLLDGSNASDFADYVNFVTVQMRKEHQNGQETLDEVRIDRNNFNSAGNRFNLLYGWKGDNDRSRWMEYDYRVQWSFFGGHLVEGPWQTAGFQSLALSAPFERRTVQLEAEPGELEGRNVRAITVTFYYMLGEEERSHQVTLRPGKGELSRIATIMLPKGQLEYDYEISWRIRGGEKLESGKKRTRADVIYVDELPGAGA